MDNLLSLILNRSTMCNESRKYDGCDRKRVSSIAILIALVSLIKKTPSGAFFMPIFKIKNGRL